MKKPIQKNAIDLRKELIISDFKTYSEDIRSDTEKINNFRQWELTVFAAVMSFALSQGLFRPYLSIIIGVVAAFAILETINRGRMALRHDLVRKIEQMLMNEEDEYILNNYVFSHLLWQKTSRRVKIKIMIAALISPQFIAWNISLLVIITVLWLGFP